MNSQYRVGRYPYWRKLDGTHVIKVGKWYIEYGASAHYIYLYSTYANRDNYGHQLPIELRDGKPYVPLGINSNVPEYAQKAIFQLVKRFGIEKEGI
jgi:hypothetical protein